MSRQSSSLEYSYCSEYNTKDLILYALGIGAANENLLWAYENSPHFQVYPLFPLALAFRESNRDVVKFPSHVLDPLLPEEFIDYEKLQSSGVDMTRVQAIHIEQRFRLLDDFPVPEVGGENVSIKIIRRVVEVQPKSIGVFVSSVTNYFNSDGYNLATAYSLMLLKNFPSSVVSRYIESSFHSSLELEKQKKYVACLDHLHMEPCKVIEYLIPQNQALIYRLSGDYNIIHVENSCDGSSAILHGLCSLGIISRLALENIQEMVEHQFDHDKWYIKDVYTKFVFPIRIGSMLSISFWNQMKCEDASCQLILFEARSRNKLSIKGYFIMKHRKRNSFRSKL